MPMLDRISKADLIQFLSDCAAQASQTLIQDVSGKSSRHQILLRLPQRRGKIWTKRASPSRLLEDPERLPLRLSLMVHMQICPIRCINFLLLGSVLPLV